MCRLLLEYLPISDNIRGKALCHAAGRGHTEVARLLLEGLSLERHWRGRGLIDFALCFAAWGGHLDTVNFLLTEHTVSEAAQLLAALMATFKGHWEIEKRLLSAKGVGARILASTGLVVLTGCIYYGWQIGQTSGAFPNSG